MKTTKTSYGDYEVMKDGNVAYTISKGSVGWNLYEGEDTLRGWLDSFDTLKEAKNSVGA